MTNKVFDHAWLCGVTIGCLSLVAIGRGEPPQPSSDNQSPAAENAPPAGDSARPAVESVEPMGDPPGLVRLAKDYDLWIDTKRKLVVVDGRVCLREGQLEMFACPKGTKEHESIVAVNCKSQFVHAALLAVGAVPGRPVQFDPEYVPASGTPIEIMVLWKDKDGNKKKARAQDWIKHQKTGQAMPFDWVFGGSGFWTDPDSGKRYYHADDGDLICVSNFGTATLDLPVESSQANDQLLFTAFTERIPPENTPVRLVLFAKATNKPSTVKVVPRKPSDEPAPPN